MSQRGVVCSMGWWRILLVATAISGTCDFVLGQSLLQQAASSSPSAWGKARSSSAYPLKSITRLPFYGVPYGLVDTTTGRLAFRVDDLSLPGRMPIQMSRFYDSGGSDNHNGDLIGGILAENPGESSVEPGDLGPFWSLSYTDRITLKDDVYTLTPAEGGPIQFKVNGTTNTYQRAQRFPSDHLYLTVPNPYVVEETRADGSVWTYAMVGPDTYFLDTIVDSHGNYIVLSYIGTNLVKVENSDGSWVSIQRTGLYPSETCTPCPLHDQGCLDAQKECTIPPPVARVEILSDSAGREIRFEYHGAYLQMASWEDVRHKTWEIDSSAVAGRVKYITDPESRQILAVDHDGHGRIMGCSTGNGASTYAYESTYTTVTDPRGNAWTYTFNETGITTQIQDPATGQSTITLDIDNNISGYTDPRGSAWSFTYDAGGRIASASSPTTPPAVWSYTYDASGKLESVTNPRGIVKRIARNAQGDITGEHEDFDADGLVGALEPTWEATYESNGDLQSITKPNGSIFQFSHDSDGQIETVTLPCPSSPCPVVAFDFDDMGHLTAVHRPKSASASATWTYEYDESGLLNAAVDPTGLTQSYSYDNSGLLTSAQDPSRGLSQFSYNNAYNLASVQNALGATTTMVYDVAGNLLEQHDALGNQTSFAYDLRGQLFSRTDPLGRAWIFGRDSAGNVTTLTHPNGASVAMTYDEVGRLDSRTYPDGIAELYAYDPNGNVLSVNRDADGSLQDSLTFTYNERDLPSSVVTTFKNGLERGVGFTYDINGNRLSSFPTVSTDHWSTTYSYDMLDHMTGVSYYPAQFFSPESYTITYDPWTMRRTSFPTRGHPAALTYTGFDDAGRLTGFQLSEGSADDGSYSLSYGVNGKVSAVAKSGGASTSYHYDAIGRLVRQVSGDGTQRAFQYDNLGKMLSALVVGSDGVEGRRTDYTYDAVGDLASLNNEAAHIDYQYDYSLNPALGMLSISRTVSRGQTASSRIVVGYDSRIAKEFDVASTGETLKATYLWYPFLTAQLETLTTPGQVGSMVDRNFVDALGGPAVSSTGTNPFENFVWYDQGAVVDEFRRSTLSSPQAVQGLTDRVDFRLFAGRMGLDPAGNSGSLFLGPRTGVFRGLASTLDQMTRRDELPPKLVSLGALDALPSTRFYDKDAEALLVPASLGTPDELAGGRGVDSMVGQSAFEGGGSLLGIAANGGTAGPGLLAPASFRGYPIHTGCGPGSFTCVPRERGTVEVVLPGSDKLEGDVRNNIFTLPGVPFYPGRLPSHCGSGSASYMCGSGGGCGLVPDYHLDGVQEPYRNSAGDAYSVEVSTGEFVLSVTDLEIPWPGMPFRFTRTYRSKTSHATELGFNWSHNYQERVTPGSTDCGAGWVRGDAWGGMFSSQVEHQRLWTGPKGSHLVMQHFEITNTSDPNYATHKAGRLGHHGATYVLRLPDGEIHYFGRVVLDDNQAEVVIIPRSYLSRVEDRFGNGIDFDYVLKNTCAPPSCPSGEGVPVLRLSRARGSFGRSAAFRYDDYARLTSIDDCGQNDCLANANLALRSVAFGHCTPGPANVCSPANDDLLSVTSPKTSYDAEVPEDYFPTGKTAKYAYSSYYSPGAPYPISDHKLTQITNGLDQAFQTITYYPYSSGAERANNHRVHYISLGNQTVQYSYGQDSIYGPRTTVENGTEKTEYFFDGNTGHLKMRKIYPDPNTFITDSYGYSDKDELTSAKTGELFDGTTNRYHLEEYLHDTRGNLVEKRVIPDGRSPSGTGHLITRYAYDPIFNQVRATTDPRAFPGCASTSQCVYAGEGYLSASLVQKHTTWRVFDYQERPYNKANPADASNDPALKAYIDEWGLQGAVQSSTISLNTTASDINGNGMTDPIHGAVMRESHQLDTEPDNTAVGDYPATMYQYNDRGQPTRTDTLMKNGPSRVTSYQYGSTGLGAGYLTQTTMQIDGDSSASIAYTYDTYGNVATLSANMDATLTPLEFRE